MNKRLVLLIVFIAIAGVIIAQNKKVAIMEPKANEGVSAFQSNMVRGGMETAVVNADGYEGYDRTAFDVIMQEQNFQRSGVVDEKQIRKLGIMAGVQYVLVTEASTEAGFFYIQAKILDVETGGYLSSANQLCDAIPTDIKEACDDLGMLLFGGEDYKNIRKDIPKKHLSSESINVPIALCLFDYNSDIFMPNERNSFLFETLSDLLNNYSITGFRIESLRTPDESDLLGRAGAVLSQIKTEIRRIGLNADDYEFKTRDTDMDVDVFKHIVSNSAIKDKDAIVNILSKDPGALSWLCDYYPELERDIFPLLRRACVYVY